jgi:hypothetical protein
MGLDFGMKGDVIPDKDHIARYCRPTDIAEGQLQAPAFMLRDNERGLSVNWLEFLSCDSRENEIAEVRNIYSAKLNRVSAGAKIAVLNAGEVREKVCTEHPDNLIVDIIHEPSKIDPSHSEINNLTHGDEFTAELIIETVLEIHSAR